DRMPDRLQLRRRLAYVVPRIGRLADPVPDVVPPDDRIRDVIVRDAEVLLRLRVERALLAEVAVRANLLLDLRDDRRVVDHLVLVGGRRREEVEDVVGALCSALGRSARWMVDVLALVSALYSRITERLCR